MTTETGWTPKHGPSAIRALVGGRFFGATFARADGSVRRGVFQLGVRGPDVVGVGLSYDPDERGNLIVWDVAKQDYRTIKVSRLQSIRFGGQEIVLN